MSDFFDRISGLSPKRLALLALELKERLDASEDRAREPIAIVGMGIRFPGASSPQELAHLLDTGGDAIGEVPRDRWDIDAYFDPDPDVPGRMNTRYGGFLDDVAGFDPAHFGIAPREAAGMDPQQRLFLEVAWEALEHAGIAPDRLAGSQTGVFLGISTLDYATLMLQRGAGALDLYSSSGGSHAVAAGRLSYILGLQGPAVSVDTACSSSLVAVHLACQSLRSAECDAAIVGGVNVICAPETTLMLSRARMMAPDGRCKTFDSRADGFVRGEGCGVLVLKRLAAAHAAGDRVLAVIRGSAVNQDGRSSGLTAPNGPAQEAVIRAALANAGISAAAVSYVEAHGTGTSLGDPIELRTLGAVYGAGRDARSALVTSSVKTNFGHLEAAAGVAGIAKTVLALQQERIPAHLHVVTPTPHVDWTTLGVRLPAVGGEAWTRASTPRLAGVSSFGFSGTNAHVILEEAPLPAAAPRAAGADRVCLLPLAARTTTAVRELAGRYASHLRAHPQAALADVCDEAAVSRAQHTGARAVVLSRSPAGAAEALTRLASTTGAAASEVLDNATVIAADDPGADAAEVAFVFTGQGGAHPQMGRALFDGAPVFRDEMTRLDAPFREATGVSLLDVVYGAASDEFGRPEVSSTALVAFQIALAALWRSWGVEPAAVAGHSLGEYAAAVTAGALSATDALRMVAARGRAVGALPAGVGAMAIVDAAPEVIESTIGEVIGAPAVLEIAAMNAPEQVVLTGPADAVARAEAALTAAGIRVRALSGIAHAYHSAQLDPLLAEYLAVCTTATQHTPQVEWISCLTGDVQHTDQPVSPRYWIDQMRQPVQWRRVVATLASRGVRVLLEIGPTAVLSGLSRASLHAAGVTTATSLPSMRLGIDPWSTMLESLGRGWVRGMAVDWTRVVQGTGLRAPLPTSPFQRERYWLPLTTRARQSGGARPAGLLGPRISSPVVSFDVPIDASAPPVLREHVVRDHPLFAGSAFIDIALAAAAQLPGLAAVDLHEVRFLSPLEVGTGDRSAVLSLEDRDDGGVRITLSSVNADAPAQSAWTRHAQLRAMPAAVASAPAPTALSAVQAALPEVLDHDAVYLAFRDRDITLGSSVRGIRTLWRRDGEALAQLSVASTVPAAERRAAMLDAALQTFGLASPQYHQRAGDGPVRVLARIGTVRIMGDLSSADWCHATIAAAATNDAWDGAMSLLNAAGETVAVFEGMQLVVPGAGGASLDTLTYRVAWHAAPPAAHEALSSPVILATHAAGRLADLGEEHRLADYDTLIPALESAAIAFARDAFATLGLADAGAVLTDAQLEGVVPQHHQLVRRLAPLVHHAPDALVAADETVRAQARSLGAGEMALLERCGSALAAVLRGSEDPLQLLFPGGSFAVLDAIYRDSSFARTYNGALRDAFLGEAAARSGRPLRILEIGAGTGGTTAYLLEHIPAGSRYVFSDLSPLFLERARERFGEHRSIECRLLDIERDPVAQGFAAGSFDVIIASNVLHATASIQQTLAHVRSLAAPNALLLLLEGTAPLHWVDLTFGLTDGWWRFNDRDLRPSHPLISADAWMRQLALAGFSEPAHARPARGAGAAFGTQSLLVARAPSTTADPGPVLIVADRSGVGDALAAQLAAEGTPHHVVRPTGLAAEAVRNEIMAFRARHRMQTTLVYLSALDVVTGVATDDAQVAATDVVVDELPVAVMRAAAADGAPMHVWMVTSGAQSVLPGDAVPSPEQAPLWGWSRGFALEQPSSHRGCLDLDPAMTVQEQANTVVCALRDSSDEDQFAVRAGTRYVARLTREAAPPVVAVAMHADGAYLITGGTGGIGLRVARWLADHGAGELVLLSRSGLALDAGDSRMAALDALRATGCTVHLVQADVGDAAAMAAVVSRFGTEWKPLRGIVHAAVQMSAAPITSLAEGDRASMRGGKVNAARHLHRLTRDTPLDFFVLCSSTTSLLGVHGMAHYAAANQYLDALAHHRRATGQTALAVAWGTWDVMRVASAADQAAIARGGLRQLSSAVALDLLGRLLATDAAAAVVADVDWRTLVPLYEARRPRPLIHGLDADTAHGSEPAPKRAGAGPVGPSTIQRLQAAAPDQRQDLLESLVRHEVAVVLGYANDDGIPVDRGFFELGLDSLMSVDLKRRLEAAVGQSLPSTLTFNYPNVLALAGGLSALLFAAPAVDTVPAPASVVVPPTTPARDTDHLSDDELEAELLARLEKLRLQ